MSYGDLDKVYTGLGNVLLRNDTKPSFEPMLTSR